MTGEFFRYISEAARIADQLEPHLASQGKHAADRIGRRPTATGGKAPIRIGIASVLDEYDRDLLQDLAIRTAAREDLDGNAPDVRFSNRQAGATRLIEMLNDGQDPEPLTARTAVTFRRHLTVLVCALADAERARRMRRPRQHAPAEGVPARTVVPASLLNGQPGLLVCVHPECDETPGVPRALNVLDEVLFNDPERLVTLEEVGVLLGISEAAARARITRARHAGHDLPVIDHRTSAKGQRQNLHRLAALVKVNSIGRDLGTAMADWPNKRLPRRRRPNSDT